MLASFLCLVLSSMGLITVVESFSLVHKFLNSVTMSESNKGPQPVICSITSFLQCIHAEENAHLRLSQTCFLFLLLHTLGQSVTPVNSPATMDRYHTTLSSKVLYRSFPIHFYLIPQYTLILDSFLLWSLSSSSHLLLSDRQP